MGFVQTVLALIVTLGILVTFHEFGHFWVARRCGVKVLRFSVGFGKPLFSWYDRHGTEFAVAAIPLGGYVRMLDEREGEVPPDQLHQAFNRQSVGRRIAIVSAGPLANFLLAIVAYWLLFVSGVSAIAPVIGDVVPQSPAAKAGLQPQEEIVAVDGKQTRSWQDVNLQLVRRAGESGALHIKVLPPEQAQPHTVEVSLSSWLKGEEQPNPLKSLGIEPYRPPVPPVIGEVLPEGRAAAAGLQAGDRILAVDGEPVENWYEWVKLVRGHPEETLELTVERTGTLLDVSMAPATRELSDGTVIGYIGAAGEPVEWPDEMRREISYSVLGAWWPALQKTGSMTWLTLESLQKMVVGLLSVKHLSGPITIARVASDSVKSGLESFLNFLAYLSISLGVLNLLPIPILDGGHLMFYLIELVKGRPVSEKAQAMGMRIGIALLASVMLLAFYNDLMRL